MTRQSAIALYRKYVTVLSDPTASLQERGEVRDRLDVLLMTAVLLFGLDFARSLEELSGGDGYDSSGGAKAI